MHYEYLLPRNDVVESKEEVRDLSYVIRHMQYQVLVDIHCTVRNSAMLTQLQAAQKGIYFRSFAYLAWLVS
jgi:succinylglutamate desuccinylase